MTKEKFEVLRNKYKVLSKREITEQIGVLWSDVEMERDLTREEISELFNILFPLERF